MKYILAMFFFMSLVTVGYATENNSVPFHEQDREFIERKILCIENSVYQLEDILAKIERCMYRPEKIEEHLKDAIVLVENIKAALE